MAQLPALSTPPPPRTRDANGSARTAQDEPLPSFEVSAPFATPGVAAPHALPSTIPPAPRLGSLTASVGAHSAAAPESSSTGMWANAPGWLATAGEAVRGRLPLPLRERVQAYPGAKVFAVSAATGIVFFGLFAGVGGAAYRTLKPSEAHVPAAAVSKDSAATATPAASAAGTVDTTTALSAKDAPKPADEAKVLLELGDSLLAQHRDGDVPALLQRLVARQPSLKDDAHVQRLALAAAASDDRRASGDAFTLLTGPMGEAGAALVYALSLEAGARAQTRARAQSWLGSKDFERVAPLPVYAAAKLRTATSCEDKHALLDFAGAVGGKDVLAYLKELEGQTSCKPDDLIHCQPCLRNDSKLSDTISKLEHSPH